MVTTLAESPEAVTGSEYEYDFFISHASEDKDSLVRPLAKALEDRGARVWYDEFTLNIGDSIHEAVSRGLRASRAGIVVLSHDFFAKRWPRHELDGLMALANRRPGNSILPIWHGVTALQVSGFSPGLAGIFALSTAILQPDQIADILITGSGPQSTPETPPRPDVVDFDSRDLDQLANESFARRLELLASSGVGSPAYLVNGFYEIAFALLPTPEPVNLKTVIQRVRDAGKLKLSGWPPFAEMTVPEWQPYPFSDGVEAWLGRPQTNGAWLIQNSPDLSDYWRATKDGMLYTIRGFTEDRESESAGEWIDIALPIARIAESLLFARRYADLFNATEALSARIRFTGLTGRRLKASPFDYFIRDQRVSRTHEVKCQALITCSEIDHSLPGVIKALLSNLYEQFGFFELEMPLIQNEVSKLVSGRGMYN